MFVAPQVRNAKVGLSKWTFPTRLLCSARKPKKTGTLLKIRPKTYPDRSSKKDTVLKKFSCFALAAFLISALQLLGCLYLEHIHRSQHPFSLPVGGGRYWKNIACFYLSLLTRKAGQIILLPSQSGSALTAALVRKNYPINLFLSRLFRTELKLEAAVKSQSIERQGQPPPSTFYIM